MSPDHGHVLELTARRWRWLRWPLKTTRWERVCRCKEADAKAEELRELGSRNPELRVSVYCDVRGLRELFADGEHQEPPSW